MVPRGGQTSSKDSSSSSSHNNSNSILPTAHKVVISHDTTPDVRGVSKRPHCQHIQSVVRIPAHVAHMELERSLQGELLVVASGWVSVCCPQGPLGMAASRKAVALA